MIGGKSPAEKVQGFGGFSSDDFQIMESRSFSYSLRATPERLTIVEDSSRAYVVVVVTLLRHTSPKYQNTIALLGENFV